VKEVQDFFFNVDLTILAVFCECMVGQAEVVNGLEKVNKTVPTNAVMFT
jgi:hypothetical protein